MTQIKILLCDDEKLIRQALKLLLGQDQRLEIVEEASNGQEALEQCRKLAVDLVLMDMRMPLVDGAEATKLIKAEFPQIEILILTTFNDIKYITKALDNGAKGYLLKDSEPELIIESIVAASKGSVALTPEIAQQLSQASQSTEPDVAETFSLDPRLKEEDLPLIRYVASGLNNKEIARELYLSEGTVKNKVSALLQSLDLRDRTQLAAFAWRSGLMEN